MFAALDLLSCSTQGKQPLGRPRVHGEVAGECEEQPGGGCRIRDASEGLARAHREVCGRPDGKPVVPLRIGEIPYEDVVKAICGRDCFLG